jgi:hypothetical protein
MKEVGWAFITYWFPSSTNLANMNSRLLQLLWSVTHFFITIVFFINLILLIGSAIFIRICKEPIVQSDGALISELELIHLQGFLYIMAGTIVFYTALISCSIEVGDPRFRVPTDSLIVFMTVLGIDLWRRLVTLLSGK